MPVMMGITYDHLEQFGAPSSCSSTWCRDRLSDCLQYGLHRADYMQDLEKEFEKQGVNEFLR